MQQHQSSSSVAMLRAAAQLCSRAPLPKRFPLPASPCLRASLLQFSSSAFAAEQFANVDEEPPISTPDAKQFPPPGAFGAPLKDPFQPGHVPAAAPSSAPPGGDDAAAISKFPISPVLISGLASRGITTLFPIQRAVLEPALRGQDLIARAKTGTGKTLAFGIPILDRIIRESQKMPRRFGKAPLAVVLAPTRELAKQVENELKESAQNVDVICVYGGVPIETQLRQLQRGVDVAVGTPGRIIDLLQRGSLNLREVQYIVLDEADRMLAVGFAEDVEKIFEHLPAQKQSMLFSATMPDWVQNLARRYLKNHLVVDLVGNNDEKLAEGIKLLSISTSSMARRSILGDLITVYGKGCKSIIFTQTKRDADDVALFLARTMGCEALHGDISQFQREKTLKSFRDGRISVLIATDVAARGLDIPNVDLVIHYEVANDPETFVHRSGRTGRAGKEGTAILMHSEMQRRTLDLLERELGCKFQSIMPPCAEDVLRSSAEQAVSKLQSVHPDVRNIFLPTADKLLSEQGPAALAAAIAHVCGCTQPPSSRSLISHEQGLMTLKITCPGGLPMTSPAAVSRSLSQIYTVAANSLGRVCMLHESEGEGAVFDLPEKIAKELLSLKIGSGEIIEAIKKLPKIVEDAFGGDRFGRPSPRSTFGRPSSGGFFGGRADGGFNRNNNRPADGGNWSSRFPSGSGNSDWSSRSSTGGDWSGRQPSYGNGGVSNSSPSSFSVNSGPSRFPSFGSGESSGDRFFSGKCLACGQPGHRAVECPTTRKGL